MTEHVFHAPKCIPHAVARGCLASNLHRARGGTELRHGGNRRLDGRGRLGGLV